MEAIVVQAQKQAAEVVGSVDAMRMLRPDIAKPRGNMYEPTRARRALPPDSRAASGSGSVSASAPLRTSVLSRNERAPMRLDSCQSCRCRGSRLRGEKRSMDEVF